jgi:antitoxin FitA
LRAHVGRMAKTIRIRNVPDDLHRTLEVHAARAGMTLSDYLLSYLLCEAELDTGKPTLGEPMDRLADSEPLETSEPPHEIIRRRREAL